MRIYKNSMELFTASCSNNRLLLRKDEHKQIVMDSLAFMAHEKRIWLYGYAIMEDEFHLLWKKQPGWEDRNIKQMLLKFTAQQIKRRLWVEDRKELALYRSDLHDRQFQFWDKASCSTVVSDAVAAEEKIGHLHEAPVLAGLCKDTTDYDFSSAAFYQSGHDPECILTNYQRYFPP
jgi:REP element-mobilizing transposase RayT